MSNHTADKRPLFIFCGGKSRRMGTDKALLRIGSETFLEHLVRRSHDRYPAIGLLSNGRSYGMSLTAYFDQLPECGPLGGLLTAMTESTYPEFASITVDSPGISDRLLQLLASRPLSKTSDAAIVRSPASVHPLTGIFRTRCAPLLRKRVECGELRVLDFIRSIKTVYLPCEEREIVNINTIDDYKNLQQRHGRPDL